MILNLPWIVKRKNILKKIFLEFIIYLIFLITLSLINTNYKIYINTYFIFIYIFSSYVFGRYHFNNFDKIKILIQEISYIPLIFIFNFLFTSDNFINIIFIFLNLFISLIIKFNIIRTIKDKLSYSLIGLNKSFYEQNKKKLLDDFSENNIEFNVFYDLNLIPQIPTKESYLVLHDYNKLNKENLEILFSLKKNGYKLISFLDFCDRTIQRYPSFLIKDIDVSSNMLKLVDKGVEIRIKRILEVILSVILLFFSSPLILIASLLIFIEDTGPVVYSQGRTGFKGREMKIYKLRTMKRSHNEKETFKWALKNDKRITKVGKYLRKYRIDELLQLISVIKGDMSLIGPRPEIPSIETRLRNQIPNYDLRYEIKPGISGWAQVNYPYGASISDSSIKLSYDLFYIKNYSLWLDLLIFFKTLKLVIGGKGSIPNP